MPASNNSGQCVIRGSGHYSCSTGFVVTNFATCFQIPSCHAKFSVVAKPNADEGCNKELSAECLNKNSLTRLVHALKLTIFVSCIAPPH